MKQYSGQRAREYEATRHKQAKWRWEELVVTQVLARLDGEIASVIDAPVGTGRFLGLYRVPAVGYDVSADMLNVARELHPGAVLYKRDLVREALPEAADLVVSVRFLNLLDTPGALAALGHLLNAARKYALFTCRMAPAGYRGPWRVGRVYIHEREAVVGTIERHGFQIKIPDSRVFSDAVGGEYNLLLARRVA